VFADPIWLLNALGVRLDRFVFCTKMSVNDTNSVTFGRETRKGAHDTDNAVKYGTLVLFKAPKSNSEMMISEKDSRGPIPEAVNLRCDSNCASAELSYRQLPEHDELMVFQFDEYRAECRAELVSRG
jgi:hypothetical protein